MAVESIRDFTGRGETSSRTVQIRPENKVADTDAARSARPSFGDLVKDFAADVNNMQLQAGHAIDMLVTGEAADVHQVMVAVEKEGVALDLMLEIRNRVLKGYQKLIRMQV